jgi:mRNA (2'-O-methyladenosine-N6-)-methyltransferase
MLLHFLKHFTSLGRPLPAGRYLEIFGRKNNLRDFWVTVGNEVTGQGPPKEDLEALETLQRIPNAVYGKGGGGGA